MTDVPKPIEENEHPPQPEIDEPQTETECPPTPDHSFVVVSMGSKMAAELARNGEQDIVAFLLAVGEELVSLDPMWGYLSADAQDNRKTVHLPNAQIVAADAILHGTTFQEIHILKNALESPTPAETHWVLVPGHQTAKQKSGWYPINIPAQKEAQATKGELE
jgi:hypothetical protein